MYVPWSQMYRKKVPRGPSLLKDRESVQIAPLALLSWIDMSMAMPRVGCVGPCTAWAIFTGEPVW